MVLHQLDAQRWRCVLTGIPFATLKKEGEPKRQGFKCDSISCDRIVSNQGYVTTNVRFVLNVVNLFRNDGDDERMFMIAKALVHREEARTMRPSVLSRIFSLGVQKDLGATEGYRVIVADPPWP
jgi:hypothetical protein